MFIGTEEDARGRLERMTSASSEPVLDSADVDELLQDCRRADRYSLAPSDEDWEGTYDLNWAAAEGWERKAAKAASTNQYLRDARGDASDFTYLNCRRMAEQYRNKIVGSVRVAGRSRYPEVVL